ncbi:unnamed protein product [Adineta steineri]|uniref:Uncharacterized protein n=1 Tax=Adineta steineri TaxID=433720 RepID=A0A815TZM4_9BILA|nr:unnamed protein product [Adineta steineri]CAF3941253.1 unnamed protein product [Adineta steineri]
MEATDESDVEEFDPMLFSSPSNSISNSDNEDHTQALEDKLNLNLLFDNDHIATSIESQTTIINQNLQSPDEDSMTHLDSTNIAAVVEVVSEDIPQQPATELKTRKKRAVAPTGERFYSTRSRK